MSKEDYKEMQEQRQAELMAESDDGKKSVKDRIDDAW